MNKIIIGLNTIILIVGLAISGFQINTKNTVRLRLDPSIVKVSGDKSLSGEIQIFNCGKDTIRLPEYVGIGYEGDVFNDYYFDILDNNKKPVKIDKIHYKSVLNPNTLVPIAPGHNFKYRFKVIHYPIRIPGEYYVRVVFCNDLAFLGASDYIKLSIKKH